MSNKSKVRKTKSMEGNNISTIKNKKSIKKLLIACIIVILLLIGIGMVNKTNKNGKFTQTVTLQENTFYLATHKDTPVIFYKYPHMITTTSENPSIGHYVPYEQASTHRRDKNAYVDFKELKNPRAIFSFEGLAEIQNILLSNDKKYLMMSFIGGKMDTTNYIYQVNLEQSISKLYWKHEIRSGYPPYNGGIAHVLNFIPDRYVVFAIIKGNPPPSELPVGVIIKNLQSGRESILGIVGNIRIDINNNLVSYHPLKETKITCEGNNDPACFTGDKHKKSYLPSNQTLTQTLP